MKMRRLAEIDLADFAAIDDNRLLENALRRYHAGGGFWSYDPVRSSTSDIVGAQFPLYGKQPRVPWDRIKKQIAASCRRGSMQERSNVEVGKLLYEFTNDRISGALPFAMGRMPIGFDETVRYWSDIILVDKDGPLIPFFDHRRSNGLETARSKHIVYSMQNVWVRERHPDLSEVRLALISFPVVSDERKVVLEFHQSSDLMGYSELNDRIERVYKMWARVSSERPAHHRATGTDGQGSLFP